MATLSTLAADFKAFKSIVTASILGYPLEVNEIQVNKDGTPKTSSPTGRFPCLETPDGTLTESNAICRFIARARPEGNLYGGSFFASGQIDSYIDWSLINLETPALLQVLPILGHMQKNYQVIKKAQADFESGLQKLEADLSLRTFLVGDRLSLADIVICCILYYPMKFFMDAAYRRRYPNVTRFFSFLIATPHFYKVVGPYIPCVTAVSPLPGKKKGKAKKKKQQQPKKKKKQQQQPKKKQDAPKKPKDPVKEFIRSVKKPKTPIDEWKRQYSNPPGGRNNNYTSMPWFWEFFDPEEYSLYLQDFKYQEENKMDFMTNNKAKGFMQRSESAKKLAFGVMQVLDSFEANGYYALKGVWLFVGPTPKILELANPEYETFKWTKLDHTNADDRKLVEDYWCSNCEKECDGFMSDDWAIFR